MNERLLLVALRDVEADPKAWDQRAYASCFATYVVRAGGGEMMGREHAYVPGLGRGHVEVLAAQLIGLRDHSLSAPVPIIFNSRMNTLPKLRAAIHTFLEDHRAMSRV